MACLPAAVSESLDREPFMAALPEGEVFTAEQVAAWLQIHVLTVRKWLREGKLQGFRAGRHWRVTREALEAFTRVPGQAEEPSP